MSIIETLHSYPKSCFGRFYVHHAENINAPDEPPALSLVIAGPKQTPKRGDVLSAVIDLLSLELEAQDYVEQIAERATADGFVGFRVIGV